MNHRNITLGDNHIPHQWEYANATARLAASGFAPADVGKLSRQLDTNSLWMLIDDSPATWAQVGSAGAPVAIVLGIGDEITAITSGTNKLIFRMPFAMTLTSVRGSLATAQTSGSIFTVDINEGGTTVLSTKLTIDNTEKTSTTAATAAVISDSALADDAEISIDVDQVGDGTAKGLKVALIGIR